MNELWTLHNTVFEKNFFSQPEYPSNKDKVNSLITSRLPTHGKPLAEAANYHFNKPGKMLRSQMAMHGASSLNINQAAAIRWAAAIEVLHNASLVHDDICDGDKQRRGQQAIWSKFGRDIALTLGDWLIALAFEFASEAAELSNTPRLLRILAKHMQLTTAGEARELEWDCNLDWDAYLNIAADKTAPLLTAPLQGIVVMAGDHKAEKTILRYFRDLGEAYQISNDISNFDGSDGAKLIAGDLARRAPNAVTLSFLDTLNSKDRSSFQSWYQSGNTKDFSFWRERIFHSDAIEKATKRMFSTLNRATHTANYLSVEISEITSPIHRLILQACNATSNNLEA